MDPPRYFYSAGVFIGLSYYAKGSGLILIPVYSLFCLVQAGFKILRHRKLWHCFAIVFLIITSWFMRNIVNFGSPTFSTQQ